MAKRERFPSVGDRINCDPNRDDGDVQHRWTNPNRESALVMARFTDDTAGECFVYRVARSGYYPRFFVMTAFSWDHSPQWAIGPLPRGPRGTDQKESHGG